MDYIQHGIAYEIRPTNLLRPSHTQHRVDLPDDDPDAIDHLAQLFALQHHCVDQFAILLQVFLVLLGRCWLRFQIELVLQRYQAFDVRVLHAEICKK